MPSALKRPLLPHDGDSPKIAQLAAEKTHNDVGKSEVTITSTDVGGSASAGAPNNNGIAAVESQSLQLRSSEPPTARRDYGAWFMPLSVSIRPVTASGGRGAYRVEAIDMFRGLTMFICVVVNNRGGYFDTGVQTLSDYPVLQTLLLGYRHVPWNGIYFSDIVLPFFHTAMGCGVFLNYGKKTPHTNQCPAVDERLDVPLKDQLSDRDTFLRERTKKQWLFRKLAAKRMARLFSLGLLLQGRNFVDLSQFHIPGILQRHGYAFLCMTTLVTTFPCDQSKFKSVAELWSVDSSNFSGGTPRQSVPMPLTRRVVNIIMTAIYLVRANIWPWLIVVAIVIFWSCVMMFVAVPREGCVAGDWAYLTTGPHGTGHPTPKNMRCNIEGYLDGMLFGCSHLDGVYIGQGKFDLAADYEHQACFDPEGVVSAHMIFFNVLMGVHVGSIVHCFHSQKNIPNKKVRVLEQWLLGMVTMFGLSYFTEYGLGIAMNKQMWSATFMFYTLGWAFATLSLLYVAHDMWILDQSHNSTAPVGDQENTTDASPCPPSRRFQDVKKYIRRVFSSPLIALGQNTILIWVTFAGLANPVSIACFAVGDFQIEFLDIQLCKDGATYVKPLSLAIVFSFLVGVVMLKWVLWLQRRGIFVIV